VSILRRCPYKKHWRQSSGTSTNKYNTIPSHGLGARAANGICRKSCNASGLWRGCRPKLDRDWLLAAQDISVSSRSGDTVVSDVYYWIDSHTTMVDCRLTSHRPIAVGGWVAIWRQRELKGKGGEIRRERGAVCEELRRKSWKHNTGGEHKVAVKKWLRRMKYCTVQYLPCPTITMVQHSTVQYSIVQS
jgi:hypothetical protein